MSWQKALLRKQTAEARLGTIMHVQLASRCVRYLWVNEAVWLSLRRGEPMQPFLPLEDVQKWGTPMHEEASCPRR